MDLQTIITLIARHVLTTLAGALVAHGIIQASASEGFIGACMVIVGVLWSIWDKRGRAWLEAEKTRLEIMLAYRSNLKQPPAPSVGVKP